MLAGVLESNRIQVESLLKRIMNTQPRTVGIVGLTFKEGTDDVRESPMVTVVEQLCGKGHDVRIYDEHLSLPAMVGANLSFALLSIPHLAELLTSDLQAVVNDADVLAVSHRLTAETWNGITWTEQLRVIDLVNIPELLNAPNYEGLYW